MSITEQDSQQHTPDGPAKKTVETEIDFEAFSHLDIDGRPTIETNNRQLRSKSKDTANAIRDANDPPCLFHGDTGLTVISYDKDQNPYLRPAGREVVQHLMSQSANWISTAYMPLKTGGFKEIVKQVSPPRDLAENYLSLPKWPGVPPIYGIVTSPIVAPNGSICATRGYHKAARLFLSLPYDFELPDTTPTAENVEAAKDLIFNRLLGNVAFADESSRCHAFALMLLPFVRLLIDGPTPLHLIDAPTQSSGKSYAAKICISPFSVPKASVTKGDEEEWRKAILSALISGRSHIFLDNVKGQLSSPMLAAAITEPVLTERAMGGLGEISVRVRTVWVATSNNARLDSDTASRCVVIRLDTGMENPERRAFDFDPIGYINKNHAEVAGAILTLVRNWQRQKSRAYAGKKQTRFGTWQSVIGGIVEANEIGGFLDNLDIFREALDPEKAAWGALCELWAETHGSNFVTVKDVLPLALEIPEIAATLGDRDGRGQMLRLGKQLGYRRDKVFAHMKICAGIPGRSGATYNLLSTAGMDDEEQVSPSRSTQGQLEFGNSRDHIYGED